MPEHMLKTDKEFDKALEELASQTNQTTSQVIQNAVATYKYLKTPQAGLKVSVTVSKDGGAPQELRIPER